MEISFVNYMYIIYLEVLSLKKASKKIEPVLSKLTRGQAFESLLPKIEKWFTKGVNCSTDDDSVVDPCHVTSMPSMDQLQQWRKIVEASSTSKGACINTSQRR